MVEQAEGQVTLKRVRDLLVDRGFQEAITYSFVDPKASRPCSRRAMPSCCRTRSRSRCPPCASLFPGLVQAVVYNQNRQQPRVRLFEQGLRFIKDENAENGIRQNPCWPASSPATRGRALGCQGPSRRLLRSEG